VYELKQENKTAKGFSQRKIAEKAGVHHSTVGDNKTFLWKSAKLLWETKDGLLTLVADAEPSWWRKSDLLLGFPRPEQVWQWWKGEVPPPAPNTTRHDRHTQDGGQEAHSNPENGGGHPTRHLLAPTRHTEGRPEGQGNGVAGHKTVVADELLASDSGLDKPETDAHGPVAGVAGTFQDSDKEELERDALEEMRVLMAQDRLKESQ
jgi:hypothetical protein